MPASCSVLCFFCRFLPLFLSLVFSGREKKNGEIEGFLTGNGQQGPFCIWVTAAIWILPEAHQWDGGDAGLSLEQRWMCGHRDQLLDPKSSVSPEPLALHDGVKAVNLASAQGVRR